MNTTRSERAGVTRAHGARRLGAVAFTLAAALLAGCAAAPEVAYHPARESALLDGSAVFGEPVSTAEVADVSILAVNEAMHAFLDDVVGEAKIDNVRFRRLFNGLADAGYFESSYAANVTRTAAETFDAKAGNCLSYTNMFVALAREAGLDARFQIVDVPPSWDADSGFLIRYTHVNVLVRGFMFDPRYGEDFSVDFNDVLPDPDYPRHVISDEEATALYFANHSVSLLRNGDLRAAFANLKKSLELWPDNPDFWINLGAFYSKQQALGEALGAYQTALYHDPYNRGALSGLARTNQLLGNEAKAREYGELVRRYRERNPYYHYALAQAAFESADYDHALEYINAALGLKYRSGRFHFFKGLTEHKLGRADAAEASFQRAARYGNFRELKRRYVSEVAKAQPLG